MCGVFNLVVQRMTIVSFLNGLSLGGAEKAACRWAWGLQERGHRVVVLTLKDGPRRAELERRGVLIRMVDATAQAVSEAIRETAPDVIHAHAPGHPHEGDVLGQGLALLPKIPVVQTNIFGHLQNSKEDVWTDFRLFVSWTSCAQAARRAFRRLDEKFFRRASVAVYPVDAAPSPPPAGIRAFREQLGVTEDEVLLGRLSRPEPNKWTNLALDACRLAMRRERRIKLLLREPPARVAEKLGASRDAGRFLILPATADAEELRLTTAALDVVLHTSLIGESFGYGIAEPMNLGKPVITHSVPWQDQAQIELVRHGECGFVASTPATMAEAILNLANDAALRQEMGLTAQRHIRLLADPSASIVRLERALQTALAGRDNADAVDDLKQAAAAAEYLDAQQFGHRLGDQLKLRPFYWRVRFHQFRYALRSHFGSGVPNSSRR